ncbi:iron-siderophore ABC transporter substrate-binding protein [Gloeocapsopsis sp. IPPAS B-1203]|uniref:ABC transporter substrate-binding protein n=1 Tax=Gloeocapsopsis sp. IPPAS B-1203 TaxID=2049454 RepID=UPI000C1886CA|nr:iron-siderophore ABC transporter substrate-binding protein [Gloeocapsopsis sp. IPPAS B-1203]PIG91348.1 ABC transporter substrate-binding protein [Gloeocapsopsis sp. IPPAS B-1203]
MKISLRRFIYLLLLGVCTASLLVACNNVNNTRGTNYQPQTENCRVVKHTMGETCIPRNPQRVVTLRPDTFVNSWVLGIKPIGSADEIGAPLPQYLQGKVTQVQSVGSYDSPELEKILQLKPDLILSNSYMEAIYGQLSQIAPTVVLDYPWPPLGWKKQLEELAQVLGKEDVSQQLMNDYSQRIEALKQALGVGTASPKENRRRTLKVSVADITEDSRFTAYGEKHYSGTVLKDVGLQRPRSQTGDLFYIENISEETIPDIDGDVLFLVPLDFDQTKLKNLKQKPLWQQLNVVQRNQVYLVGEHWHESDILAINAIIDDLFNYLVNTP